MKHLKTVLLFGALLFFCSCSSTKDNRQPDWTRIQHRTQGGGWIWYPGKGEHQNHHLAALLAKGQALAYLIEECAAPHLEAKFNERYESKADNKTVVYVRASIKDSQCRESKYGSGEIKGITSNNKLWEIYTFYQNYIAGQSIDLSICRKENVYCLDQANKSADRGQWYQALRYSQYSCSKGLKGGCNTVKIILKLLNQDQYKIQLYKRSNFPDLDYCKANNNFCNKQAEQISQRIRARREKSISKKKWYYESQDVIDIGNVFMMTQYACGSQVQDACKELSRISFDKTSELKKEVLNYLKFACKNKVNPACRVLERLK
ncbi:hypothetical protein HN630_00100 [archaeon]|nr:hypothetical protein [archaeon]